MEFKDKSSGILKSKRVMEDLVLTIPIKDAAFS